jgi:hypothetical protein
MQIFQFLLIHNCINLSYQFHNFANFKFLMFLLSVYLLNKWIFIFPFTDRPLRFNLSLCPYSDFRPGTCPRNWITVRTMSRPLAVSKMRSPCPASNRDRHTNLQPRLQPIPRHSRRVAETCPWTCDQGPALQARHPHQPKRGSLCCRGFSPSPESQGTRAPPF